MGPLGTFNSEKSAIAARGWPSVSWASSWPQRLPPSSGFSCMCLALLHHSAQSREGGLGRTALDLQHFSLFTQASYLYKGKLLRFFLPDAVSD
jgi:hypothetical protein